MQPIEGGSAFFGLDIKRELTQFDSLPIREADFEAN